MTTRNDIEDWLGNAPEGATHMLVVCDSFDYSDYPSYTSNPKEKIKYFQNASMQRIMEVYDLAMDHDEQLSQQRVWNA